MQKTLNKLRKLFYAPLSPAFVKIIGTMLFGRKTIPLDKPLLAAKNLLIVKLDEIGDFVLSTPFLRELRRNYPDSKIDLIVKKEVFPLAENCPYVNRVLYFDVKMNMFFRVLQQYYRMYKIGKKYLWKVHYDLAIIPRWDSDDNYHAFVAYLSGAKEIIGYNQGNGTEKLLTRKLPQDVIQHEVKQNLAIITYLGGKIEEEKPELWLNDEDKQFVKNQLSNIESKESILIAIAPGATSKKRRWPNEKYVEHKSKVLEAISKGKI